MILAILQARVSSSRLPKKVLKTILGKPMIIHQIERIQNSRTIDKLIVATSVDPSDDVLVEVCSQYKIETFRGSLEDVLERFYQAALQYKPNHIVRLTGDCPVIDSNIIDRVIHLHLKSENDYTSNALIPTFPDGLDVEICTFDALRAAYEKADMLSEREHVTLYIYKHPERFKLGSLQNEKNLSRFRWTVDQKEDFDLITRIYHQLYSQNKFFGMHDILKLFQEDEGLLMINEKYERNEGLRKSFINDQKI